jgi:hypothetical protein
MTFYGQNPETAPFLNGYGPGTRPGSPADGVFADAPTDARARKALVLGILAIVPLSIVAGIPAIIMGVRALRAIRASGGYLRGVRTAWTGVLLGVLSFVILGSYLALR